MATEIYRFPREAMATSFEVRVATENASYASQAARAAFDEIDRLEKLLSSYIDASDISRVNRFGSQEPVLVSIDTFECLEIARRVHRDTERAFDVTIGALFKCWRKERIPPRLPTKEEVADAQARVGMEYVVLDAAEFRVGLRKAGVIIDLGGIGKGFALDKAALVLKEWGVNAALLRSGESTVLALDPPPGEEGWSVSVGSGADPSNTPGTIPLRRCAVSASGTAVKGKHIMDPRSGRSANAAVRAWASCPAAADADALSTAFMVMSTREVKRFCNEHPDTWAALLVAERRRRLLRFGLPE